MFQHSKRLLNFARMQSYSTKCISNVPFSLSAAFQRRQFSVASHESGLLEYEFDYLGFDHKVDKGNWPHNYYSYMKVLGKDYDTKAENHVKNE